jgi:hypothetical protein
MSGAMDSSTEPQTIFVELLDEGTVCLRPTQGVPLGDGRYRLLPTANYDRVRSAIRIFIVAA